MSSAWMKRVSACANAAMRLPRYSPPEPIVNRARAAIAGAAAVPGRRRDQSQSRRGMADGRAETGSCRSQWFRSSARASCGRVAVHGVLAQRLEDDRLQVAVEVRIELARRILARLRARTARRESSPKRQELVQGHPEAPDVGAGVGLRTDPGVARGPCRVACRSARRSGWHRIPPGWRMPTGPPRRH